MRHAKQYKRGSRGKAAIFFLALFAFGIFSMLLPLRPTESLMEKRKLTEFPKFSVESLANGDYTKGIDTSGSPILPGWDTFFQLNSWVRSLCIEIKTVRSSALWNRAMIPDGPFIKED